MMRVVTRPDPAYFPIPAERSDADRATAATLLQLLKRGGDCRTKKVKSIRRSVRDLQYENDLKLSIAVERLQRDELL